MSILPKASVKASTKSARWKSTQSALLFFGAGTLALLVGIRHFAQPFFKERKFQQHEREILQMLGEEPAKDNVK